MKTRITVSPNMCAFVGSGPVAANGWPADAVALTFRLAAATFCFDPAPDAETFAEADLVLLVADTACRHLFGVVPATTACWHLPIDLRAIVLAARDCPIAPPARETLRGAKCIELLCGVFAKLGEQALVPADGSGELSEAEARRIAEARRLIDERWHEKLTLDSIARACGLNRAKLTRGFRQMFATTIADAIADRRLGGARDLLLSTDLPVSSIGYRCGYLNNASFTRAFSRRFGSAPSQLRAEALAA